MESRPPAATRQLEGEARLVGLAQGGDSAAFGVLVQHYQEAAFHLACVIVGQPQEAEDVVQDAFLKAYVALPRFRPDAPVRPWLLQIVANEARNRRRADGRRSHLLLRATAGLEPISNTPSGAPSPESLALADEQRRVLVAEVNALRDADRLAIAGRYFMDLSEAEVADLLGVARGTVKSRVSRGLARLRARLTVREIVAVVVGLVLLGLGILASPDARDAIAERLGLRGVSITHVSDLPPVEGPTPGADLGLGPALSLAEARARFGGAVLIPAVLGAPDGVYVTGGQLWLVYAPRTGLPATAQAGGVGLLLAEFRATVDRQTLLGKSVPPGTRLEEVLIGGQRGYWIEGAPHLFLRNANGSFGEAPPRLAGNTLLWEQAGLTLRIESALDRDAALRIAASARAPE